MGISWCICLCNVTETTYNKYYIRIMIRICVCEKNMQCNNGFECEFVRCKPITVNCSITKVKPLCLCQSYIRKHVPNRVKQSSQMCMLYQHYTVVSGDLSKSSGLLDELLSVLVNVCLTAMFHLTS